jgi:hypothetical protein
VTFSRTCKKYLNYDQWYVYNPRMARKPASPRFDISTLSVAEQKDALRYLSMRFAEKADDAAPEEQNTWEAIRTVLRIHGVVAVPPLNVVRERVGRIRYHEASSALAEFVESGSSPGTRRMDQHAMMVTCLDCLADYLEARGIPVAPRSIISNFSMLGHAVNQAFPGYHANRMLHYVVKTG